MRYAFTLIELLVAMALGMLILVMAVITFRSTAASMADINRMARETQMLRTGYWIAMRDADFWDSHANPEAPYHKGFTRVGRGLNSAIATRRFMAPVSFSASMAPGAALSDQDAINPNVFLPHNPASWYRGGIAPPLGIHARQGGNKTPSPREWAENYKTGVTAMAVDGDYGLTQATHMPAGDRFPTIDWTGNPAIPDGGYPLHGVGTQDSAFRMVNSMLPRAQWQLFQRLSHRGWIEYMPPDTKANLADQDGWLPSYTSRPTLGGGATDTRSWFNSWFVGDWNGVGSGWNSIERTAPWRGRAHIFATDAMGIYGLQFGDGTDAAPEYRPILAADTGSYDLGARTMDQFDPLTVSASNMLGDQYSGLIAVNRADYRGDISRWATSTSTTLRLPYNLSDQEREHARLATELGGTAASYRWLDSDSKPTEVPLLRTTVLRFSKFLGGSIAVVRVQVEDPVSGFRREITVVPMTTTYRGARQHWALNHIRQGGSATSNDSRGNAPVGDFYP
jgi:hypothetical protein